MKNIERKEMEGTRQRYTEIYKSRIIDRQQNPSTAPEHAAGSKLNPTERDEEDNVKQR